MLVSLDSSDLIPTFSLHFATLNIIRILFDPPAVGWINFLLSLLFRKLRNTSNSQSQGRLDLFCTFTDVDAYWLLSDVAKSIQSCLDFDQKLALTERCRM